MRQASFFGGQDIVGSFDRFIQERLRFAIAANPDDREMQNRLVFACVVTAELQQHGVITTDEQRLKAQRALVSRRFPATDTISRSIRTARNNGLEKADFPSYYASATWERVRHGYYSRHPRKCSLCSAERTIQLHHNTYERIGGQELDSDLTPLCRQCHAKFGNVMP